MRGRRIEGRGGGGECERRERRKGGREGRGGSNKICRGRNSLPKLMNLISMYDKYILVKKKFK